jgi:tetratricopeptide (TPR) repeat protein
MKRTFLILSGLLVFMMQVNGQTMLNQFNDLLSKDDTIAQMQFLEKWGMSSKNDPDLYVAYFNFFYKKSRKEVVRIEKTPRAGQKAFQILDTLTKQPIGYMFSDIFYEPQIIDKGFKYIDIGIEKFPTRLDMRFGKIYLLGEIGDYDSFSKEIIKAIDYSQEINYKWLWKENKPMDDAKDSFLGDIQSYQVQIYNTGNDSLLNYMAQIAEEVLKFHPTHIESLSNLSVVYMIQKEYDKALEKLLEAEKINPKDYIVLSNIAQAYKLKGDKVNSIKYYELVSKYGNDDAKQYSKDQIKQLKNN